LYNINISIIIEVWNEHKFKCSNDCFSCERSISCTNTNSLAGALGKALLERLLELNWVQRLPKTPAIKITNESKIGFKETFSFDIEDN
jgi:hypothetical protein